MELPFIFEIFQQRQIAILILNSDLDSPWNSLLNTVWARISRAIQITSSDSSLLENFKNKRGSYSFGIGILCMFTFSFIF
jgi:hypothetical protein